MLVTSQSKGETLKKRGLAGKRVFLLIRASYGAPIRRAGKLFIFVP